MRTKDELLVLANFWQQHGDPRAEIARNIDDPNDVRELLQLLPESDHDEAACVFAERALLRERDLGREPDRRSWGAIETKRAWLRGEATEKELRSARHAAMQALQVMVRYERNCRGRKSDAGKARWWAAIAAADGARAAYIAAYLEAQAARVARRAEDDKWQALWILRRARAEDGTTGDANCSCPR